MPNEIKKPRVITLHWDDVVQQLECVPDHSTESSIVVEAAYQLLQRIQSENLPATFMLGISDEVFQMAAQLIEPTDDANAAVETAHFAVDDEAWDMTWRSCMRLTSLCDPSIAEVFI
ncbi:hypothetical protein LLE49_27235 [Alicyclobacillus tolerans]|uniref:hypothetical protein n=1 Tax=Alicyclobacillus tolerans TaxID=90970 RepID=UPI001F2B3384|nr:hypothetical protein [Alicyclobacillus tolerans]MCF8568416.1 hypothetical protein [Alicyclobacillus tolerans]